MIHRAIFRCINKKDSNGFIQRTTKRVANKLRVKKMRKAMRKIKKGNHLINVNPINVIDVEAGEEGQNLKF